MVKFKRARDIIMWSAIVLNVALATAILTVGFDDDFVFWVSIGLCGTLGWAIVRSLAFLVIERFKACGRRCCARDEAEWRAARASIHEVNSDSAREPLLEWKDCEPPRVASEVRVSLNGGASTPVEFTRTDHDEEEDADSTVPGAGDE